MTREEYFAQEFAKLKNEWDESKSTHWPALYDAVVLAHVNSIAPPKWVAQENLNLIVARHNASGRKRIRSQYALDYTHWRRWSALTHQFKIRGIEYSKKAGRPNGTRGIQEARQDASDSLKTECRVRSKTALTSSRKPALPAQTPGFASIGKKPTQRHRSER
jgi:hypothetical protein